MASTPTSSDNRESFFLSIKDFPPVINGRINVIEFLDASTDMISIVERLGTIFAPVKYDIQGNVDRIRQNFTYDNNSCLLDLVINETAAGKPGSVGVLWFNRSKFRKKASEQLLLRLMSSIDPHKEKSKKTKLIPKSLKSSFRPTVRRAQKNIKDTNMQQILTVAYEGSVKKYHNWTIQSTLTFICKASPTMPQFMKALEVEDGMKELEIKLESYHRSLHIVRCKIDDFFHVNRIYV